MLKWDTQKLKENAFPYVVDVKNSTLMSTDAISLYKVTTNCWKWSRRSTCMQHYLDCNACSSNYKKYPSTIQYKQVKEIILVYWLSRFPHKGNFPIKLYQNIQHIHFSSGRLNIIHKAIKWDPIHSTLYQLNLNGWSEKPHKFSHINHHFWGTRDEFTIKERILLKGDRVCTPSKLCKSTLSALDDSSKGIKMQHSSEINHLLAWNRCRYNWLCHAMYDLHQTQGNPSSPAIAPQKCPW